MMETRAHHILIGAFVLLTLVGGALFGLWVAKVNLDAEFSEYDVVFRETVTGLSKGAAVNFNGIQVGEVRRLLLDPEDPAQALARIRVDASTPVRADTRARLTYTGLTGVAIIELVAGAPDAKPLTAATSGATPQIIAIPSALQQIMNDGGDVLVRFNQALVRVSEVLSVENAEKITRTLAHVEAIAAQLDADKAELGATLGEARATFAQVRQLSSRLDALLAGGDRLLVQFEGVMNDELTPAASDLRETLAALRRSSAQLASVLDQGAAPVVQWTQQGLPALTATLEELQQLAVGMKRVVDHLDAAPADYLLQRDQPRPYQGE